MTQIQGEVARLQVMADDLLKTLPVSESATRMSVTVVPNIESLRELARTEFDETGSVTPDTISAVSKAMTGGENLAWDIIFHIAKSENEQKAAKLVARHFDNIHIMMNAFLTTEGLKCWPPEDPNCP